VEAGQATQYILKGRSLGNDLEPCFEHADCQSEYCASTGFHKICRPIEEPLGQITFTDNLFALTVNDNQRVSLQRVTQDHYKQRSQEFKAEEGGLFIFARDRNKALTKGSNGELIVSKLCAATVRCRQQQMWSMGNGVLQAASGGTVTSEVGRQTLQRDLGSYNVVAVHVGDKGANVTDDRTVGFHMKPTPMKDIRFTDGKFGSDGVDEWQTCITPCSGKSYSGFGSCKVSKTSWGSCHAPDQYPYRDAGQAVHCDVWPPLLPEIVMFMTRCKTVIPKPRGGPPPDMSGCRYWKVRNVPTERCTSCHQGDVFTAVSTVQNGEAVVPVGVCTLYPNWLVETPSTEEVEIFHTIGHSERKEEKKVSVVFLADSPHTVDKYGATTAETSGDQDTQESFKKTRKRVSRRSALEAQHEKVQKSQDQDKSSAQDKAIGSLQNKEKIHKKRSVAEQATQNIMQLVNAESLSKMGKPAGPTTKHSMSIGNPRNKRNGHVETELNELDDMQDDLLQLEDMQDDLLQLEAGRGRRAAFLSTSGSFTLSSGGGGSPSGSGTAISTTTLDTTNPPPTPPPAQDCQVNSWGDWTRCTKTCGGGDQLSTRTVKVQPQHGGQACQTLERKQPCSEQSCCDATCVNKELEAKAQEKTDKENSVKRSENSVKRSEKEGKDEQTRKNQEKARLEAQQEKEQKDTNEKVAKAKQAGDQAKQESLKKKRDESALKAQQEKVQKVQEKEKQSKREKKVKAKAAQDALAAEQAAKVAEQAAKAAQKCETSAWSQWSKCFPPCGDGIKKQTRSIISKKKEGCGSLEKSTPCEQPRCRPPSGPIPPTETKSEVITSMVKLDELNHQQTVVRRAPDGTSTKTTVTVTREIQQESVEQRPWSLYVQMQRGLLAKAIEHGEMKTWALFVRASQMSGCVVQTWVDRSKALSDDQCMKASKTFDCLSLDASIAKAEIHNSSSIWLDPVLRKQCMQETTGGHECGSLHKVLFTSA